MRGHGIVLKPCCFSLLFLLAMWEAHFLIQTLSLGASERMLVNDIFPRKGIIQVTPNTFVILLIYCKNLLIYFFFMIQHAAYFYLVFFCFVLTAQS